MKGFWSNIDVVENEFAQGCKAAARMVVGFVRASCMIAPLYYQPYSVHGNPRSEFVG